MGILVNIIAYILIAVIILLILAIFYGLAEITNGDFPLFIVLAIVVHDLIKYSQTNLMHIEIILALIALALIFRKKS